MTGGARPSASARRRATQAEQAAVAWAALGRLRSSGCSGALGRGKTGGGCTLGLRWAKSNHGPEWDRGKGLKKGFLILKTPKQLNSNPDLNSNTSKPCTGMYATANAYISLIN
jgi:hypothetical protein